MKPTEVAKAIDWTPSFANQFLPTETELDEWCRIAIQRGIGHLFVSPMFIKRAKAKVSGSGVRIFGPLDAAPLGLGTVGCKLALVPELIALGVDEIDTMMNLYAFANGRYSEAEGELRAVVSAAKKLKPDVLVKVIIETGLWNESQLKDAAKLVAQAGADFVKTCLGLGPRGVSERDVELIQEAVGGRIGIKASGGISSGKQAVRLLELGASRLGISQALQVLDTL